MINFFKRHKALTFLAIGVSGFVLIVFAWLIFLTVTTSQETTIFSTYAAPQIGVALDQNRVVVEVLPGSPAEMAGILLGDVFKQVGNTDLTSFGDLSYAFHREISAVTILKKGVMVTADLPLVVSRNGQTLNILVHPASPPFNFTPSNRIPSTAVPAPADWVYI